MTVLRTASLVLLIATFALPVLAQDTPAIQVARVKYGGGGDWYGDEQSLVQLLRFVKENTLLDVAESVGYRSPSAFAKAFKSLLHESPAAYRKRLRQSSE